MPSTQKQKTTHSLGAWSSLSFIHLNLSIVQLTLGSPVGETSSVASDMPRAAISKQTPRSSGSYNHSIPSFKMILKP